MKVAGTREPARLLRLPRSPLKQALKQALATP